MYMMLAGKEKQRDNLPVRLAAVSSVISAAAYFNGHVKPVCLKYFQWVFQ